METESNENVQRIELFLSVNEGDEEPEMAHALRSLMTFDFSGCHRVTIRSRKWMKCPWDDITTFRRLHSVDLGLERMRFSEAQSCAFVTAESSNIRWHDVRFDHDGEAFFTAMLNRRNPFPCTSKENFPSRQGTSIVCSNG